MQRSTWAFVIFSWVIAAGCAAIAGIEQTTTIATLDDASVDGGTDVEVIDEIPDAAEVAVDASLCADAAARLRGVNAVEVKTATGDICPPDPRNRILDLDGEGVGLDSIASPESITPTRWVDDEGKERGVHGCVGVEFDGGLTAVMVRAKMAGQGCQTNCEGSGCNTYRYVGVWLRRADGGMQFLSAQPLTRDVYSDKVVMLADGGTVTNPFVVTCRTSLAYTRDDIVVDYVGGCR